MKPILFVSFALILACVSASALATPPAPADLLQYDTAVKDAAHWGQLMFDHDQAAWKATDIVFKDRSASADKRKRGWITEASDAGIRVVFVGEENGKFIALYETTPSSQSDFVVDSPSRELTADELAEFNARNTAIAAMTSRCADKYNSVVLPEGSGTDRKWRVYLMPGVTDPNIIPFGGYYRYEISEDGKTVLDHRAFTKSCAMIPKDKQSGGFTPVGSMITHLLDPEPTEVHVFVSLTYKQPVFVITGQSALAWEVSGRAIKAVEKLQPSPQVPAEH